MSTRIDLLRLLLSVALAMCVGMSVGHAKPRAAVPASGDTPADQASAPSEARSVQAALEAGNLTTALERARAQRKASPTPAHWHTEAEILERMGRYEAAADAYEAELEALPPGAEGREAVQADLERVRLAARGAVEDEPASTHREELDHEWAPAAGPDEARAPRPVPPPAKPRDERIIRKWYFWVTVAAIVASAAAITGIAIKASRDDKGDALDLTRDQGPLGPTLLRF